MVAQPVVAGEGYECTYDHADGVVRITLTGDDQHSIARTEEGVITVDGDNCSDGGLLVATVDNTDRIIITSGAGTQRPVIRLGNGGFRPGRTNEPGSSDEIELSVLLGSGDDQLFISGATGGDVIRIGSVAAGLSRARRLNLNAGEATGIDHDMTVNFEDAILLNLNGGHDVVSGKGGVGTGSTADVPLTMSGGKGDDRLTGGTRLDVLVGNEGSDVLKGLGDDDNLFTNDGVGGNDVANGGPGNGDSCKTDAGDVEISC
jgi:hypothetical protein